MGLGSKHPMELIVPLLNKVTKSGVLRGNVGSKGQLLLLNGPKGGLDICIVSRGKFRGGTRFGLTSEWGWRRCKANNLRITRYPMKVSPVK